MSKYDPLYNYLSKQTNQTLLLSFCEIEGILGFELPSSAADYTQW